MLCEASQLAACLALVPKGCLNPIPPSRLRTKNFAITMTFDLKAKEVQGSEEFPLTSTFPAAITLL